MPWPGFTRRDAGGKHDVIASNDPCRKPPTALAAPPAPLTKALTQVAANQTAKPAGRDRSGGDAVFGPSRARLERDADPEIGIINLTG